MSTNNQIIQVQELVHERIENVWNAWTKPEHIMQWNNASDDWHTPHAENDLKVGGRFLFNMAAKDGSVDFDFTGQYTEIILHQKIAYVLDDGRKVSIEFTQVSDGVQISELFEPESENSHELQKQGWQAILTNFKMYLEEI